VAAVVDLPSRLDNLIAVLPPHHQYTADSLIDSNTLWPFYAPFLPLERVKIVRNAMKGREDNRIRERLGSATGQIKVPAYLRFCQGCVKEDREKIGETYWHRIHQVTGVEICPRHQVFLKPSTVSWLERNRDEKYITAEKGIAPIPEKACKVDMSNRDHSILLKIADNAAWLLNWQGPSPGSEILRERYYNLLLKSGYAYYNGRIRTTKLLNNFVEFYTPDLLAELQCEIGNVGECWLLRIVRSHKATIVQHPLRHLLLIIFLGYTAEEVFTKFIPYKPFGEGPWPCLNRAASHYQQLVITECPVTDSIAKHKTGVPMGTFKCGCGFIYTRRGPDRSEKDSFRFDNVISYGPVWEKSLREQWLDPTLAISEIANNLGVIPLTVIRHAIRLKLPSHRQSRNSVPIAKEKLEKYSKTRRTLENSLQPRRSEWLSAIKANPKAGRRQLQSLAYYTYWWLRRNDPEWLEEHMPQSRKPPPPPIRVDWKKEDADLLPGVEKAIISIKLAGGRPIQITLCEIVRRVGHKYWLERCRHKLPLTSATLDRYLEPYEDYLVRRVRWAADFYLEVGIRPTLYQLKRRAGVHYGKEKLPKVKNAIETALESLYTKN
jgi:hypothetical protein